MKGDFTRDTFRPEKHFSRVLHQQGRVTVDADDNEQTAILLHYLRTLARDLIGSHAAPVENSGFKLSYESDKGVMIGKGRCYVDGILVENDEPCSYMKQPDYTPASDDALVGETGKVVWVYLDVWERHITALEDDEIREKALGDPDTCTRAKVVWQVKALPTDLVVGEGEAEPEGADCESQLVQLHPGRPKLAARIDPGETSDDPCITAPESKYRGLENQLYRVEIHDGSDPESNAEVATFKWSRDNGSVATAWLGSAGDDLLVGRARGFASGNWVELSDDTLELQGKPGTLVKLAKVEGDTLTVDPGTWPESGAFSWSKGLVNPKVRRWDQADTDEVELVQGAMKITESTGDTPVWIDLEDGVQIRFPGGGPYRTGDYWLIPARVATGLLEWPPATDAKGKEVGKPLPPHGVEHHFAPLGFLWWQGGEMLQKSCHCEFKPLSSCFVMPEQVSPDRREQKPKPGGGRRKRGKGVA